MYKAKVIFVPAHTGIKDNIAPLSDFNIRKVYEIAEKITQICSVPTCFEQILQKLFNKYNLKMKIFYKTLIE